MDEIYSAISLTLRKHGIDDLALEMEINNAVRGVLDGKRPPRTPEKTREDIRAALIKSGSAGDIKQLILSTTIAELHMNPSDKSGLDFLEHAYLRHLHGENIETFTKWWIKNAGEPKYWSFRNMIVKWPMAFARHITAKDADLGKWEQGTFVPAIGEKGDKT